MISAAGLTWIVGAAFLTAALYVKTMLHDLLVPSALSTAAIAVGGSFVGFATVQLCLVCPCCVRLSTTMLKWAVQYQRKRGVHVRPTAERRRRGSPGGSPWHVGPHDLWGFPSLMAYGGPHAQASIGSTGRGRAHA